jgi:hypothetical protein
MFLLFRVLTELNLLQQLSAGAENVMMSMCNQFQAEGDDICWQCRVSFLHLILMDVSVYV